MNEEIRSTIALIAGAIVFVVCYIKLFLKGKSSRQRFIERAKEQGSFVTATLIDHKRRLGNDESGNSYFQIVFAIVAFELAYCLLKLI